MAIDHPDSSRHVALKGRVFSSDAPSSSSSAAAASSSSASEEGRKIYIVHDHDEQIVNDRMRTIVVERHR